VPEFIDLLKKLADTGKVEFLAETYAHSLSSLIDPEEFTMQVRAHDDKIYELFGQRPKVLRMFLAKITRNLSFDRFRARNTEKRGGGEIVLVLDELSDCIPSNQNVEHEVEAAEFVQLIDSFVMSLSPMERRVFICRYWYFDPISEIAQRFGFSQSKVKMMLHRQRKNLLNRLEREEFL